jgi:hypothetical protein
MVNTSEPKTVNIGDLVQWTRDGVDQFDTPRRIRAMQMHDQQEWAFVEGSKTGMPVSDLTVVTSASAVMEEAPADPVASALMSATRKPSLASLSAQHAARTFDLSTGRAGTPEAALHRRYSGSSRKAHFPYFLARSHADLRSWCHRFSSRHLRLRLDEPIPKAVTYRDRSAVIVAKSDANAAGTYRDRNAVIVAKPNASVAASASSRQDRAGRAQRV